MGEVSETTSITDQGAHARLDPVQGLPRCSGGAHHGPSKSHGPAYGFHSRVTGVSVPHSATALDSLPGQSVRGYDARHHPTATPPATSSGTCMSISIATSFTSSRFTIAGKCCRGNKASWPLGAAAGGVDPALATCACGLPTLGQHLHLAVGGATLVCPLDLRRREIR